MLAHVEGYGCSTNLADTEQIRGALLEHGFKICGTPEAAELLIINTCAVKQQTESRMLKRVRQLGEISRMRKSLLVVFGCLAEISPAKVEAAASAAHSSVLVPPDLGELLKRLNLSPNGFSPSNRVVQSNEHVSVITIARGCMGKCTFCCVRGARGALKSYHAREIAMRFSRDLRSGMREFWLTAQDTAAYGLDINSSLPTLLQKLLEHKGGYRIRIGMMNPENLMRIYPRLVPLMGDERIYRFLHIPLQSGSDRVLRAMGRNYTAKQFLRLVNRLRSDIPFLTISTDVIAGFPGETDTDFASTMRVLEAAKPDIVNISRYGGRPRTAAAEMQGQVHGGVKKQRSRALTKLCSRLALERNKSLVGTCPDVLISGVDGNGNLLGRTGNYKPVILKHCSPCCFTRARITSAHQTWLSADSL